MRDPRSFHGLALLLAVVVSLTVAACSGSDPSPYAEGEAPTSVDQLPVLVNPNLATDAQLSALPGMTPEAQAALADARPFMDMLTVDAALAAHMDEAARQALYLRLWVPLNVNTASDPEMKLIPGVGNKMAHEFEEYRPYDGMPRFRREIGKYVDDVELERLARYVFVPVELNSASDEAILAIPGVGERMLHEFKEYRPYSSLEQFRREIGKYVDDGEVARLERYVTLGEGA